MQLSTRARRLILVAAAVLLPLLAGEVFLRLFWTNPYRGQGDSWVVPLRLHRPNTDRWIDRSLIDREVPRVRLRTDARAYILPSGPSPDPTETVLFLGGSTTECEAVQEPLRFPALTCSLLADDGLRVRCLNAARSGNCLQDSINILLNHALPDAPDFAVVMNATNDVGILSRPAGYGLRAARTLTISDALGVPAGRLSSWSSLAGICRRSLEQAQIEPRVVVPGADGKTRAIPAEPFRARLRAFVRLCRSVGVVPILMTEPQAIRRTILTPEWSDKGNQDVFNEVIRGVAREESSALVDLAADMEELHPGWDRSLDLLYDGVHVTDAGSRFYAERIVAVLEPLLRGVAPR